MPSFEHHGARIYYEEFGQGFPILTFAPAGLDSVIEVWSQPSAPINPTTEFADRFPRHRDGSAQRRRPVARPDHRAGRLGQLHRRPHRAARPSAHRPLSSVRPVHRRLVHPEPDQAPARARRSAPCWRSRSAASARCRRPPARFNAWAATLKDHPEATPQVLDAFYRNLYAPGFVYCVDRDFVPTVRTPCLVLAGNDEAHPYAIAEELEGCCRTASSSRNGRPARR